MPRNLLDITFSFMERCFKNRRYTSQIVPYPEFKDDRPIMPFIELTNRNWDYDNLEKEQIVDLYATLTAQVLYPQNDNLRQVVHAAILTTLSNKVRGEDLMKRLTIFPLQFVVDGSKNEIQTRINALDRITSYLCRMITHHHQELRTGASLGKAIFLTEKWAERKNLRGYGNSSLKAAWRNGKGVAPLTTAIVRASRRIHRKYRPLANQQIPKPLMIKYLSEQIEAAIDALQPALFIQNQLSAHRPSSGVRRVLEPDDLLRFPEQLVIKPRPIKWRPLHPKDLDRLRDYADTVYWNHLPKPPPKCA